MTYKFVHWHRYVDDLVTCDRGMDRQLVNFINSVNVIHHNIKFTMEIEITINFLALTLTRLNSRHDVPIYHKHIPTDSAISNKSNNPTQHNPNI